MKVTAVASMNATVPAREVVLAKLDVPMKAGVLADAIVPTKAVVLTKMDVSSKTAI